MFRSWVYWLLFLSSYAPLFLILALRSLGCLVAASLMIGAFLLSLVIVRFVEYRSRKVTVTQFEPLSLRANASEVTGYLASYIIPFALIDTGDWRDWAAFAILFIVVGRIYVSSDLIYINPTLNFAGYRILELTDKSGASYKLVTNYKVHEKFVYAHPVSEGVLLEQRSSA